MMKVFVIMPFAQEFDDVYKLGIKETAKDLGIDVYRLDEELFDEGMLDKIYKEIDSCDFLIADLSSKNSNVFYELGYAHALEKLCILITNSAENIPFDLKHKRHIIYNSSITSLKEQLAENLKWAKEKIESRKLSPFLMNTNVSGYLNKDSNHVEVILEILIDIKNISQKVSQEIISIVLSSFQNWKISQNGKELMMRKIENKYYKYDYVLETDIKKLPKNGWTEIKLSCRRILASKVLGEPLLDNFNLQGTMPVEIHTDKGSFQFELPLDIKLAVAPF